MKKCFCIVFILLLAVSVMTVSVFAESGSHVRKIGQLAGGLPREVFVTNGYAYAAAGGLLSIINVSAPSNPVQVAYYDTPGYCRDVYVSGNYAYVADGGSGLRVIDVSTPSSPTEVGFYDTSGDAQGVFISGNYAYVADWTRGLRVIDISTPSSPSEVGFYDTPGYAAKVYVSSNYAYVADNSFGLRVIAISNPSSPTEVGFYDTSGNAIGVYVSGDYAYVANGLSGLRVIAVSNPSSPSEVGFYDTSGYTRDVFVSGTYAYIADYMEGLRIIDISTPSSLSEVGFYDTTGSAYGVYVSGNYAYVADDSSGLRIIDISTPSSTSEVGFYDTPGSAQDVYVKGNYAYVADDSQGLRVVDISTPLSPTEVGHYNTQRNARGVDVRGNYAYLAEDNRGLRIIDISTPSSPTEVGFYNTPGNSYDVHISGNYAYVADYVEGLRVIDISTPSSPSEVGFYDTPGRAYGVYVSGNYAYVADRTQGLRVIDISTPSSPSEVGFYDTSGTAYDVVVTNGYAYVADGNRGLRIIDISTPSSPTEIGFYNTSGNAQDVWVTGAYAYIADGNRGLRIIDISTPSSPTEVGFYITPRIAQGLYIDSNYAYIADSTSGLYILEPLLPPSNPSWSSITGITPTSFTVSWNDVSLEDNYHYILSNAVTGAIVSNLLLAADTTSKAQDGLDTNTTYYVKLYATNTNGVSATIETNVTTVSPSLGSTNADVVLNNFEDGETRNYYCQWDYAYGYGDTTAPCSATANVSSLAIQSNEGAGGTSRSVMTTVTIQGINGANDCYAGAVYSIPFLDESGGGNPTNDYLDVSASTNITFYARTSDGTYNLSVKVINKTVNVGDNDYIHTVTVTPSWQLFTVSLESNAVSGFAQDSGWGVMQPWSDIVDHLNVVEFEVAENISNISFYFDEIRIGGTVVQHGSTTSQCPDYSPFIPTGLYADNVQETNMTLHWTDTSSGVHQEDMYVVYRNTANDFSTATAIVTNAADTTSYDVEGLSTNTMYYFWVQVENMYDTKTSAVFSNATVPGAPSAPSNVIADSVTATNCIVHWVDMSSGGSQEDNFIVYQNTNAVFSGAAAIASLAADTTNYTVTGLSAHTTYYFWILASNATGSTVSTSNSITTPFGPPAAPTGLRADGIAQTNLVLHWIDNSSGGSQEEAFIVYQNTSNAFATASRIGTTIADATNISVIGLTTNTSYYFWVEATNANARSHSAGYTVTTLPGAPSAPSNVIADSISTTNCILHWVDMSSGGSQEDNFIVYQNTANNFSAATAIATLAADTTNYTVTGLKAETVYYFWVRAINQAGNATAAACMVTTSNATVAGSTKEASVGPNPGKNGESMIFGPLPKNVRIEIYDAIGNQVNSIDVPANQPSYVWTLKNSDDETIAPGIYFARIINTDDESDYKIIKLAVVR